MLTSTPVAPAMLVSRRGEEIAGATGVLVSITASEDIQLDEVEVASQMIHEEAHPDATIIWGAAFDPTLVDEIKVTIIATGFIENAGKPKDLSAQKRPVIAEAPKVEVPVQPVVEEKPVAPTVAAAPVVTEAPKVEAPAPEKRTLKDDLKKADDMLSFMDQYDEDFVFLKKNKG